jgi:hypothetical protein
VIQIDVHPIGETQPTRHAHPTLGPRMVPDHTYLTRSTHSNLWHSCQQIWTDPLLLRRRAPDPTHSTLADWPMGPHLWHAISMFNTCSRGWTHQSLTDIDGGYNYRGADFPHHTPRPSQSMALRFSPKSPIRSQLALIQSKYPHNLSLVDHQHLMDLLPWISNSGSMRSRSIVCIWW